MNYLSDLFEGVAVMASLVCLVCGLGFGFCALLDLCFPKVKN